VKTKKRTLINAGSATDLHVKGAGFNVYDIDPAAHRVKVTRREWSEGQHRYLDAPGSPMVRELSTRD